MDHVLVIEDTYLFGEYLRDIAVMAGASSVAITTTEGEAIAAAQAHTPQLILADVHLAPGDGPAAVSAIVAEHGPIPVIFVTGDVAGCTRYPAAAAILGKPVSAGALLTAIDRATMVRGSPPPA